MKIHEYQAKELLRRYGIPIPAGEVATSVEQVVEIASRLSAPYVIKAQVHVGGRGKAGGVKLARDVDEARAVAQRILGMDIKGLTVEKVLVTEAVDIAQEYYLGITLDRGNQCNTLIISAEGGVDIEDVAARTPEKVLREPIDPAYGLLPHQAVKVLYAAGIAPQAVRGAAKILVALAKAYTDLDCSLAEINPLVLTPDGQVLAIDAKINIDDNALYRHPEFAALAEDSEEDPIEAEAHRRGLQYVRLEAANIGGAEPCVGIIGNGAGLVMGTLDEVTRVGKGRGVGPANFLDIGGGARADVVRNALEVTVSNPDVRGVFINIFGGITRCDEVAKGILAATETLELKVPLVVRLTGTNEDEGRALLAADGRYLPFTQFGEAAEAIVGAVAG